MNMTFAFLLALCALSLVESKALWCGNFKGDWQNKWGTVTGYSKDEPHTVVSDPQFGQVFQVTYKEGSLGGSEGSTWWAAPSAIASGKTKLCVSYKVKFQNDFKWQKGGKLPGLYGFAPTSPRMCTGGRYLSSCFSTRFMWRAGGEGTVYAYIPESGLRCEDKQNVVCNKDYGSDLGRGVWDFPDGQWATIYQEVKLNDIGKKNGFIKVWFNNNNPRKPTFTYDKTVIRTNSNILINNILFSTFFGGNDDDWRSPKTQKAWFTDFALADSCSDLMAGRLNFDSSTCTASAKAVIESTDSALDTTNTTDTTSNTTDTTSTTSTTTTSSSSTTNTMYIWYSLGGVCGFIVLLGGFIAVVGSVKNSGLTPEGTERV